MDDRLFDSFARAVSACASRRQALRIAGLVALTACRPERGLAAARQGAGECEPGLSFCEQVGACVDLMSDLNNCGACGSVCESGLVAVACRDGLCVRADCAPDLTYCGAVDLCRDLTSDPGHCGACGNACASGVCCGGACVETCCDNNNCGACGTVCPDGLTCFEGVCDCPSGLCGPIQLPNTGSGSTAPGGSRWAPVALAGVGAALLAGARRLVGGVGVR